MQRQTSIETREGNIYLVFTCQLSIPIGQKHFETMLFVNGEPVPYPFDTLPGSKKWGVYQRYVTETEAKAGHNKFEGRVLNILTKRKLIL